MSKEKSISLICGHFEGVDERVLTTRNIEEISIGDYILSGGETAALVVLDSILRLLPGVLGNDKSSLDETFENGLLEYPQYTKPQIWEEKGVPEVLLSGDHSKEKLVMSNVEKLDVNKGPSSKAIGKMLRTSPIKLNDAVKSIRGKNVGDALSYLEFSKKRISNEAKKILESAIANAENNHNLDIDKLYVDEAYVGKNLVMKRFRPRARGRTGKILKPFSQLTIILREKAEGEKK